MIPDNSDNNELVKDHGPSPSQEDSITLHLSKSELLDLLTVLGQLPTNSNAYPLWWKLRSKLPKELLNQAGTN